MVQKWTFFQLFFEGNIGQENVFYDIVERKIAFLGYKNKKFKKSKKRQFSKGVNRWFWSKNDDFSNFFFSGNKGQEHDFYDILERKIAFLGYKNKKFKKSKHWLFSKCVNSWFLSENGHFFNFFPRPFYAIQTRNSKSRKIYIFSKNLNFFNFSHGFGPMMDIFPTSFFYLI